MRPSAPAVPPPYSCAIPALPAPGSGRCRPPGTRPARAARSAMYCAVHSPTPQISRRRLTETSRSLPASNSVGSASAAEATADSVRARLRGMPSGARSAAAMAAGSGNTCVRPSCGRASGAMRRHQLAAQADRGDHGDLLAQHGAHRQFEAIPGAGDAQAGPGRRQRRQHWSCDSCAAMAAGSLSRSNCRRRRAMITGRDGSRESARWPAARRPCRVPPPPCPARRPG